MKKYYLPPEAEIEIFCIKADLISTSSIEDGNNDYDLDYYDDGATF